MYTFMAWHLDKERMLHVPHLKFIRTQFFFKQTVKFYYRQLASLSVCQTGVKVLKSRESGAPSHAT
jgi:hypothetical protein